MAEVPIGNCLYSLVPPALDIQSMLYYPLDATHVVVVCIALNHSNSLYMMINTSSSVACVVHLGWGTSHVSEHLFSYNYPSDEWFCGNTRIHIVNTTNYLSHPVQRAAMHLLACSKDTYVCK